MLFLEQNKDKITMKRKIKLVSTVLALTLLTSCTAGVAEETSETSVEETTVDITDSQITYRFADREEGVELLLANEEYYAGFSQNDLDFKMQETGATMEEYQEFASEQVLDFTEEQMDKIDASIARIEQIIDENGYELPPIDEIVFIVTTMAEEPGAGGYTHGTEIYLGDYVIDNCDEETLDYVICHELFHCLTRCNPDFRAEAYELINFTVADKDFDIPEGVFEYHISNPDVEHHDAYATFIINGEEIDCFTDFVTTAHYDQAQTDFFSVGTTALIPIDGTDIYYTPEDADNFYEVFGENTGYVIDPEECMADNFAFAIVYGMDCPGDEEYPNPEIIEGILNILGARFVG